MGKLADAAKAKGLDLEGSLRYMYWTENKSIHAIAKFFGVTSMSVHNHFVKFGIPTRSPVEATRLINRSGPNNPMFGKHRTAESRKQQAETIKETIRKKGGHWSKGQKLPQDVLERKRGLQAGEKNSHWKGGIRNYGGYVAVYMPEHPFCNKRNKTVYEHRLVMEQHLGRYLLSREVIHHKNGDKSDNRLENLELISDAITHLRLHKEQRKISR